MSTGEQKSLFHRLKIFLRTYERHLSSGALFFGFIVDSLTLRRIDLLFENILLSSYLILAFIGVLLINLFEGERVRSAFLLRARPWAPFVTQYAFGALLSGFVIFYSRSASLWTSWPFLLLLVSLFIGNEFLRKRYARLVFHVSIFFFLLFSYMIFYVPIIFGTMGEEVFLFSGAISIVLISGSVVLLRKISPSRVIPHTRKLFISIFTIYAVLNVLYFTNILPPIPLSLKAVGVYHFVERSEGGDYAVSFERDGAWYETLGFQDIVRIEKNKSLYVFSSVFAPTDLNTEIVHEWRYYDPIKETWTTLLRTGFSVIGGRDGGYRGYSEKFNVFPGKWRVDIRTENGLLVGRKSFVVEIVSDPPALEETIL